MRVRTPAQWRRKPPGRAPISSVGIWVTDGMLRRAFERYQRLSVASCRRLSSHAGPLESRRRLGKRHMSGIMPSSNPYRPAWHFEVLADRSTWQWQPPTSSTQRSAKKNKPSVSGLFNGLIEWLEDSDADKPFLQQPDDAEITAPAQALPADQISQDAVREAVTTRELHGEILALRTSISSLGEVDETMLNQLCRACKKSLRHRIFQGTLSIEELAFSMNPLDEATRSMVSHSAAASRGAAMIRRSILGSLADAQKQKPDAVSEELWMTLAKEVCVMDGKRYTVQHSVQLFWRLMNVMPLALRDQIPYDDIFTMASSFITVQAGRNSISPQWGASTIRFSNTLQMLGDLYRPTLIRKMKSFVEHDCRAPEADRSIRFTWVLVCAMDAHTTRKVFFRRCREFAGTGIQLTSLELWQLLAARLISIGVLEKGKYQDILATMNSSLSERWTSLILAILERPDRDMGMEELRLCLDHMGEYRGLALALAETPNLRRWLIDIQAEIAARDDHTDDHTLAFGLYGALQSIGESGGSKMTRRWAPWSPYVERMIKDPETEYRVFQVLNLMSTTETSVSDRKDAGRGRKELLDKMVLWYTEATHLNDRQVLRRVQQCIDYQRRLGQGPSIQAVVQAMGAVTRDLERGETGRTTRLEWLTKLIAETQGPKEAERALSALKGWRWSNEQRRRL